MLFNFHNIANRHSGATQQSMDVLKKYKRAYIKQVFDHFDNIYSYHDFMNKHLSELWFIGFAITLIILLIRSKCKCK